MKLVAGLFLAYLGFMAFGKTPDGAPVPQPTPSSSSVPDFGPNPGYGNFCGYAPTYGYEKGRIRVAPAPDGSGLQPPKPC